MAPGSSKKKEKPKPAHVPYDPIAAHYRAMQLSVAQSRTSRSSRQIKSTKSKDSIGRSSPTEPSSATGARAADPALNPLQFPTPFLQIISSYLLTAQTASTGLTTLSALMKTCKHARDVLAASFWSNAVLGRGARWDEVLVEGMGGRLGCIRTLHINHPVPSPLTSNLNWRPLSLLPNLTNLHLHIPSTTHFISALSYFPFPSAAHDFDPCFPSLQELHVHNDPGSGFSYRSRANPVMTLGGKPTISISDVPGRKAIVTAGSINGTISGAKTEAEEAEALERFSNVDLGKIFPVLRDWTYAGDPLHLRYLEWQVLSVVPKKKEDDEKGLVVEVASSSSHGAPAASVIDLAVLLPGKATPSPGAEATVLTDDQTAEPVPKYKTSFSASLHTVEFKILGTPRAYLQSRCRFSAMCDLDSKSALGKDGWDEEEEENASGQKGWVIPVDMIVALGEAGALELLKIEVDVVPNMEHFKLDFAPLRRLQALRHLHIELNQRLAPPYQRMPMGKFEYPPPRLSTHRASDPAANSQTEANHGPGDDPLLAYEPLLPWAIRQPVTNGPERGASGLILTNLRFARRITPSRDLPQQGVDQLPKFTRPEHLFSAAVDVDDAELENEAEDGFDPLAKHTRKVSKLMELFKQVAIPNLISTDQVDSDKDSVTSKPAFKVFSLSTKEEGVVQDEMTYTVTLDRKALLCKGVFHVRDKELSNVRETALGGWKLGPGGLKELDRFEVDPKLHESLL